MRLTLSFWSTEEPCGWRCRIPAWVEYKNRTGRAITDSLAVEIAGHYLKAALQAGEGLGRDMYSLTVEETLAHLEAVVAAMQSAVPA